MTFGILLFKLNLKLRTFLSVTVFRNPGFNNFAIFNLPDVPSQKHFFVGYVTQRECSPSMLKALGFIFKKCCV